MPAIDINISSDLTAAFALPSCSSFSLPPPSAAPFSISLPCGGSLSAISDLSKGIPTDCALTFSLLMQLAPFLASIECLIKVLALIKPLIDIIGGLTAVPPNLSKVGSALPAFGTAAEGLVQCFGFLIPGVGIALFIKDLLCLILKVLTCFTSQMNAIISSLQNISVQMATAQASGNAELLATLTCAQNNALAQAGYVTASLQPLQMILELAGDLMALAKVGPFTLPAMGASTSVEALQEIVQAVQEFAGVIKIATDALGGCQS
jgi:hypothetical protein